MKARRSFSAFSQAGLSITVPAYRDYCGNRDILTVTASYELEGETVYSQRKWMVKGGDIVEGQPPVYDWLVEESETETEATPADTSAPAETTAPTEPAVTEEDTTPAKKGCRSTVTATLPLLAAGCAMALAKKKRSQ